ncbi:TPA: TOBE domain-containing protein [Salmonella enterica subsp. enterica serovar Paratyphi B]|nr:TOBE domain-containing protein [Salmonella enterica subsp. enterica serovar Paratyphi B]
MAGQSGQRTVALERRSDNEITVNTVHAYRLLATEDCGLKFSARNQFTGRVTQVMEGAVNTTVHICTDTGFELVAAITNESRHKMKLAVDSRVIALIKASAILIATRT